MKKIRIKLMQIAGTIRFKIIAALSAIVLIVTVVQCVYIYGNVLPVVKEVVIEARQKNSNQVLSAVDQYFEEVATLSMKPGKNTQVTDALRASRNDVSSSDKLTNWHNVQMFLFREIMLQNKDIESALLYSLNSDAYYAISDTFLIYKDSYYNYEIHQQEHAVLAGRETYISGIHDSGMTVVPRSDHVVTFARKIIGTFPERGEELGILFINVDTDIFQAISQKYVVLDGGEYYLLDQHNNIVAASNLSSVGQPCSVFLQQDAILQESTAANTVQGDSMLTLSAPSALAGWRILKVSLLQEVFGYEDAIMRSIIVASTVMAIVAIIAIWLITTNLTKDITTIKTRLAQVSSGQLAVIFAGGRGEMREMNLSLQQMIDEINRLIRKIYTEEDEKRELELRALQNQITPHFIYNTLSRIRWMATLQQAAPVAEALGDFTDILSYCMRSPSYLINVRDEITFVKSYVAVMNLRMIHAVEVVYDIPDDILGAQLLRFLLQPLIENVFFHAFEEWDGPRLLHVHAHRQDDLLFFTLRDSGVGIDKEKLAHILDDNGTLDTTSIALRNVQSRIHHHFGQEFGIEITSEIGQGTLVGIVLPYTPHPREKEGHHE